MSRSSHGLIRPPPLAPGGRIGVFAPSYPSAAWYPERFDASVTALARAFDAEVVVTPQARRATGFTAGSVEERGAALCELLEDPSIHLVIATIGGFHSAELLPRVATIIDRVAPKPVVGYSDVSSLLLGIQALAGWITFYGPTAMVQFGEHPEPLPFTADSMRRAICSREPLGLLPDPDGWTNEFLDWGTDAWRQRARVMNRPAARQVWRAGSGSGALFGGNLETIDFLMGTPYLQVPERIVLFWEATGEEAFLPRIRRALTHLAQCGVLERATAMLIGRSPEILDIRGTSCRDVVLELTEELGIPVIADLAFGHTDPMLCLPIGVEVMVRASETAAEIDVLEPGVA